MGSNRLLNAIFIDVENQKIELIKIQDDLHSIYKQINSTSFDSVRIPNGDYVYVDGEGLLNLNNNSKFFMIEGYPSFLAGNGLILGVGGGGDSTDVHSNPEDIKNKIVFFNIYEIAQLYPEWLSRFYKI